MSEFRELLLPFGNDVNSANEKALRAPGLPARPTIPPKPLAEVVGDYQSFSDVAIDCLQFVERKPVTAHFRVGRTRQCIGLRLVISGRDGHSECFLTNAQQIDDLIGRLAKLKIDAFGKKEVVV